MKLMSTKVLLGASLAWLSGTALLAAPAADPASVQATFKADTAAWLAAYNAGNVEAIMAMYTADAVVMGPGAPVASGAAAIRQFLTKDIAGAKAAGVELVLGSSHDFGISGDLAWSSGNYTVVEKKSGTVVDSGNYLDVRHKVGGKWLTYRDMWNSDRPAAPPAAAAAAPATAPTKK